MITSSLLPGLSRFQASRPLRLAWKATLVSEIPARWWAVPDSNWRPQLSGGERPASWSAWRGRPPAVPGRWPPAGRARRRCPAAAAGRGTPPPGGGPGVAWSAGVAVGVAGGVAGLQPGLVDPQPAEVVAVGEEPRVHGHPTRPRVGVQLGRPGPDAVGVEDVVPDPVERVGDVHAAAVAADLHHLRPPSEPQLRRGGVGLTADDAAELDRAGLDGVEDVADVVLLELAGAPAGDVQPAVVDRQVDVADQRRHR